MAASLGLKEGFRFDRLPIEPSVPSGRNASQPARNARASLVATAAARVSKAPLPFAPVTIRMGYGKKHRVVKSVLDAATSLIVGWPNAGRGPAYEEARVACDAMDGSAAAQTARAAFIEAAREVGIFVLAEERKG